MSSRIFFAVLCRCGFSQAGFGQWLKRCPRCGGALKCKAHEIPGFIRPGGRVDYHSIIGGAVTLPGCCIESEVFLLGETPCVMISGKRGGVAVAALTEAV